jgi:hypothetical protein
MQVLYNHIYQTSYFAGGTSLDYPIWVEICPGYHTPFKKTTLHQELMCLPHPPDPNGNPGPTFIDGVHYVHMGPRRGHIRVLYCNLDQNKVYIEQFVNCLLSSHVYL